MKNHNRYKLVKQKGNLQAFSETINEGLEERLIMGNGLENIPIGCHVTDGPLAQSSATQSEDITGEREKMYQVI